VIIQTVVIVEIVEIVVIVVIVEIVVNSSNSTNSSNSSINKNSSNSTDSRKVVIVVIIVWRVVIVQEKNSEVFLSTHVIHCTLVMSVKLVRVCNTVSMMWVIHAQL